MSLGSSVFPKARSSGIASTAKTGLHAGDESSMSLNHSNPYPCDSRDPWSELCRESPGRLRTSRCPRSAYPRSRSRSAQPSRVPIVAVRPATRLSPPAPSAARTSPWRVVGPEERLLAVQDRRVIARRVVGALELAGPQVQLDAPEQGRVRVGLEVGVDQVGELARMAVDLDQVGPLDLAEVRPAAALIDAEERVEGSRRVRWTYRALGRSLPTGDRRQASSIAAASPARNSSSSACRQALNTAEERPDVALEPVGQRRDRRPPAETAEGKVDEQVLGPAPGDRVLIGRPNKRREGKWQSSAFKPRPFYGIFTLSAALRIKLNRRLAERSLVCRPALPQSTSTGSCSRGQGFPSGDGQDLLRNIAVSRPTFPRTVTSNDDAVGLQSVEVSRRAECWTDRTPRFNRHSRPELFWQDPNVEGHPAMSFGMPRKLVVCDAIELDKPRTSTCF